MLLWLELELELGLGSGTRIKTNPRKTEILTRY
jgi:hypothetical protein